MGSLPQRTVLNFWLTLLVAGGLLAPVLFAQQFPTSWFSSSAKLAPVVRPVAFQQQPPAAADEAGADVNKNAVDGTGPSVPELDLSMEELFDQRIGSQLENRWQFSANYTGTQAGQPLGYTSLNALRTSTLGSVLDMRLHITDFGDVGGSFGLGRRSIADDQLLGLHVSVDASETQTGSRFATANLSAELVNETWDVRANGYWPVSNQVGSANFSSISNTAFVGNELVGDVAMLQEVSLGGFDLQASRRVGGSDLWGYGGVYNYQTPGDQTWGARYGARGFLANRVFADLHVSNDSMFGSQVGFGLSWLFGGRAVEPGNIAERMASIPVRRQGLVATQFATLSLPGQTLTNPNGTPLVVQHVDSTVAPGGDGSVAAPHDTLAAVAAVAQPGDVIHLERDSVFVGESITLQPGQQLIGESDLPTGNTVATQFGPADLPAGSGGTNPAQISAAPGPAAITLAADTTVTNIDIINPAGAGIVGSGFVGNVTIDAVEIQGAAGIGISLNGITGNTQISSTTIFNSGGDGLAATSTVGDLDIDQLLIQGAGDDGIDFVLTSGSVTISNSQIVSSNANGILLFDVQSVLVDGVTVETVDVGGGGGWGLSAMTDGPLTELVVVDSFFDADLSPNSFQAQSIVGGEMTLLMSGNEANGIYDLLVEPGSFMGIAGNLGVDNLFLDSDNGNLTDNGNTTLGGPATVNAIGEFLIIPW